MNMTGCIKCGEPVERPKVGRPPLYCGAECRQAAAYEVQRLQRHLEKLEGRAINLREQLADKSSYGKAYQAARQREYAFVQSEINQHEQRLRQLLSEPRGTSPAKS